MHIAILDTVYWKGAPVKVVGFAPDNLVVVGYTNSVGEYHRLWLEREKITLKRQATIV